MYQNKTDVKYSADGTVVDYREARHMEFVSNKSHGQETDTVTVPNIPAMVCVFLNFYVIMFCDIFVFLSAFLD